MVKVFNLDGTVAHEIKLPEDRIAAAIFRQEQRDEVEDRNDCWDAGAEWAAPVRYVSDISAQFAAQAREGELLKAQLAPVTQVASHRAQSAVRRHLLQHATCVLYV